MSFGEGIFVLWLIVLQINWSTSFVLDEQGSSAKPTQAHLGATNLTTPRPCTDDPEINCQVLHSVSQICDTKNNVSKILCRQYCKYCDVVDGNWSEWSTWSGCDVTCENGTQTRTRLCNSPSPTHGGDDCVGDAHESIVCALQLCPLHGGWGLWSSWGYCSVTCGVGLQRRDRHCDSPFPDRNGDHCFGEGLVYRICNGPSCAAWSTWGPWGSCSHTCGEGIRWRNRTCAGSSNWNDGSCPGFSRDTTRCHSNCPQVAFTVTSSSNGPHSQELTFTTIVTNEGNGFNTQTGEFTCPQPGLYYFIFHLVKKRSSTVDSVICYLYKNGHSTNILAYIDPQDGATGADNGSYGVSNSAFLRLNTGDKVHLAGCNTYPETRSSFSGFLVAPDL